MAEEKKVSKAPAKPVTAVKKDESTPGFFKRVAKWFREMKSELKKVVWPSRKTLTNNVLVSLGMMCVSAVAIWIFDSLASVLVKGIFTFLG